MADTPHDKTVFVAELVPSNRKLVELSIEFANTPGAIVEVASILSKHKVNVLTGFHDTEKWSFFADVTEIESSTGDIVKEISSKAIVSKVSLSKEASEGIIVDTLHQQPVWGPFKTIIMRTEVLSSILNRVKGIFGAEGIAGKAIVYGMGEAAGRTALKGLVSQLGGKLVESQVENEIDLYTAQGWGIFRLVSVDFNSATAYVKVQNNFECAPLQGSGSSPRGSFVSGHLAGVFSEIFGKRVQVKETSCIAHGEPYCLFEVRGVEH